MEDDDLVMDDDDLVNLLNSLSDDEPNIDDSDLLSLDISDDNDNLIYGDTGPLKLAVRNEIVDKFLDGPRAKMNAKKKRDRNRDRVGLARSNEEDDQRRLRHSQNAEHTAVSRSNEEDDQRRLRQSQDAEHTAVSRTRNLALFEMNSATRAENRRLLNEDLSLAASVDESPTMPLNFHMSADTMATSFLKKQFSQVLLPYKKIFFN